MNNKKKLRLGMIGMNEGNGHPYSWSAIINGYDYKIMKDCPFPVIPEYLEKEKFPESFLTDEAKVSHIWTQEKKISDHIAKAAYIDNVVDEMVDLIDLVDAVILARDDAENHLKMATPFIEAGLPIFIDKPMVLSIKDYHAIKGIEKYKGQIFTCSSLRYAKEIQPEFLKLEELGTIKYVEAIIGKSWEKYAVHIIEPVITLLKERGMLQNVVNTGNNDLNLVTVSWKNCTGLFRVTGDVPAPLIINVYGTKGSKEIRINDTFTAFKGSLKYFIDVVNGNCENIPEIETKEIIEIIEKGAIQ